MSFLLQAAPSSLRLPAQDLRVPHDLRSSKGPGLRPAGMRVASPEARAHSIQKSRFIRMPHEDEDARLTGVTRSLARRLLALNIAGSLPARSIVTVSWTSGEQSKIA